jgi:hypothetical protein
MALEARAAASEENDRTIEQYQKRRAEKDEKAKIEDERW